MVTLLLIDCYQDNNQGKIKSYLKVIQSAGPKNLMVKVLNENDLPSSFDFYDAVMVSGARRMINDKEYNPVLLDLISRNTKPMLGICYGHQMLAAAFGCDVRKEKLLCQGREKVIKIMDDALLEDFPAHFNMEENHREIVVRNEKLFKWFRVLAVNQNNQVEIIKHRFLPAYGVQFHPEKSKKWGRRIVGNFMDQISGNQKGLTA